MQVRILGEGMALASALLWAVAVLAFEQAGKRFTPWQLNVFKGATATSLFGLTTLALSITPWREVTLVGAAMLALSGLVGITLGDTAYFAALQQLGTRRCLLIGILSPPMTALLGWLFLGERLTFSEAFGILLTLTGVAWVVSQKQEDTSPQQTGLGVIYGVVAVLAQAVGALLTRSVFNHGSPSPLTTALVRLSAATLVLLLGTVFKGARGSERTALPWSWRERGVLMAFTGTMLGTYIAMITYMSALKYASSTGVVQTLLTTSQLWGLGIAALRGERLGARAVLGALLATVGVVFIMV